MRHGLDKKLLSLLESSGVGDSLRGSVIQGITRYLEENGARLMKVAVDAVVGKLLGSKAE